MDELGDTRRRGAYFAPDAREFGGEWSDKRCLSAAASQRGFYQGACTGSSPAGYFFGAGICTEAGLRRNGRALVPRKLPGDTGTIRKVGIQVSQSGFADSVGVATLIAAPGPAQFDGTYEIDNLAASADRRDRFRWPREPNPRYALLPRSFSKARKQRQRLGIVGLRFP